MMNCREATHEELKHMYRERVIEIQQLKNRLDELKNQVYCMRELLGYVPEDIRDVATFTWKELNEIFNEGKQNE